MFEKGAKMGTELMELYYEDYISNYCNSWWKARRVLPYMVFERSSEKRERFRAFLKDEGFKQVTWNDSYLGILVNMEFRNFGLVNRPVKFARVNDRDYSIQEFIDEVYKKM